jgi:hypothetical protein
MSEDWMDKKMKFTHYMLDPTNGPGQMVSRPYNHDGNPFAVFCSNKDCENFIDRDGALPHWSEDCSEYLGVLRCPTCKAPVLKPRGEG